MSTLGGLKAKAGPMSVFLFTSEYEFLPEGVIRIKHLLEKRLNSERLYARLNYKRRTHTFDIVCHSRDYDHVMPLFHKIFTAMIETEVGDGYTELKSKFIARSESHSDEIQDTESDEASEAAPLHLISDRVKFEWKCHTEYLILEAIVPKIALEQIESLTGTKLIRDLNRQLVHIDAPSQEACDRATHKLEILRKYHLLAYIKLNHIFYTEDKATYEVTIRSLLEIKKKFIETTLLDPLSCKWQYYELKRAFTIRCCPYEPGRNKYVLKTGQKWIPAVPLKAKDAIFDLWAEYTYPPKGNISIKRIRDEIPRLPSTEPLSASQAIRSWLTIGSPDIEAENLNQKVEEFSGTKAISLARLIDTDLQKVAPEATGNPDEKIQGDITDAYGRKTLALKNGNLPSLNTVHEENCFLGIPPGQPLAFRTAASRELRKKISYISNNPVNERLGVTISNVYSNSGKQSASSGEAVSDNGFNSTIDPKRSQSLMDVEILESDKRQLSAAEFRVLEPIKYGKVSHSGGDFPTATPQPTIRRETEVETRKYHETMRQGAPKRDKGKEKAYVPPPLTPKKDKGKGKAPLSPPLAAPAAAESVFISNSEYTINMAACLKLILSSLRNWQGEIRLQVHFGRILIKPFHPNVTGTPERPRSYTPKDARELLCKYPGKVSMTKVISTLPADIQFFLDMKGETYQPLWGEVMSWKVTYEYVCCDHNDYDGNCSPVFVIEMNADSFEAKVHSVPQNFGVVYVHCTMRNWDYCVSATGWRGLEEDYGDVVKEIAESTYIPPNQKNVSMSFEISKKYPIHIVAIRVRRHSQYPSFDGKTLLNVTEVHNLDIGWQEGDNTIIHFASSADGKEPKAQSVEPMWYEMNITSAEAQEAFKENMSLEFGEETEWHHDLLLDTGVVMNDMCEPANYLITKMDGMGHYNNNGHKPVPADVESLASTRAQAPDAVGFQFW